MHQTLMFHTQMKLIRVEETFWVVVAANIEISEVVSSDMCKIKSDLHCTIAIE